MALVLFIYWFLHIILCKSDESNENFSPKSESNHIRIIQDPDDEIIKSDPSKHKKAQKIINFASESAGATVLATSDECSGFSSVLTDDKDKYAMCPCSAKKKHVTIGLSEDLLITSIVLKSFEKYSSTIENFSVLGSLSYPTNEWIDLGNYTVSTDSLSAINSKVMQYVQDFNMITNRLNEKAERAAQASMTAAMEVSVDGTVATGQEFGMENLVEPEDDADMIDMELYEQAKAIRSLPQPIPFTSAPGEEIFPLKLSSPVWTRYLKFKFNEFQGREYYCTLTQVVVHGTTVLESFKQEMQRGEEEVRSLQSAVHSAAFEAFDTSSTKEQLESQDRTQEEQSSVAVEDVAVIENEHDGFTPDVPSGEEAHMDGRAVLPPSQESVSGGMTDNFSGEDATIHLEETGVRTNNHDGEGDTSRGMAMDDPTGVDTETTHSGNQNGENLVAHSGEALSGASSVSLSGPEGITKGSDPDEAESEVDVSPNVNSSTPKAELNLTDQIIGEYVDDNTGQGTASLLDSPSGGANNSDHSSGAGSDIALTAVVGANRLMHMGVNIDTIQNIDWNGTRGGEVMLDGDVLLKPDASVSSGGRSSGSNNTVGAAVTGDTWLDLNTTAGASGNSNSTGTGELEFRIMTEDLAEDPDEGALNDTHSLAGAGDLKDNDTGSCKTTANVRATEVPLGDNITNSKDQDSPDGIAPDSILGDVQRNSYTVSDVRILQSNVSDAAVPATASVFAPMTAGLSSNSASDGVHPLSPPSVVNASLVDANKELPEFGMDTSSGNGTTKITSENVIVTGYGNEVRNESSTGVVEDLTPQVLKDMYNQLTNATSGFAVANLSAVNNSNVPVNASLAASPCIDILKFSAFQAKMIAKLNLPPNFMDSSNIFTSTHSNPSLHHDGKNLNENVFRTLMQRIKSLEMKYAIIEKYASQLGDCYGYLLEDTLYAVSLIKSVTKSVETQKNEIMQEFKMLQNEQQKQRDIFFSEMHENITSSYDLLLRQHAEQTPVDYGSGLSVEDVVYLRKYILPRKHLSKSQHPPHSNATSNTVSDSSPGSNAKQSPVVGFGLVTYDQDLITIEFPNRSELPIFYVVFYAILYSVGIGFAVVVCSKMM